MTLAERIAAYPPETRVSFLFPIGEKASGEDIVDIAELRECLLPVGVPYHIGKRPCECPGILHEASCEFAK